VEKIEFPLSDLAEETLETFQALAKTQNKTISGEIEPMLSMTGDEKAIQQLIGILMDNAVKYSDAGGKIELSLKKQKNTIQLSVCNTVESISKEELSPLV
jgi:signal transduction histidine kinase